MIDCFDGEFAFLSNFYPSPIFDGNIWFPTVEHYFQAAKTTSMEEYKAIAAADTPGQAKRLGRKVMLRPDWEEVKDQVMLEALRKKFSIPTLREQLLATENKYLIEGNTWGDKYWGVCEGEGLNHLGALLMRVREELKMKSPN
jgi:ribA/ribD-fused uncharacterized protein